MKAGDKCIYVYKNVFLGALKELHMRAVLFSTSFPVGRKKTQAHVFFQLTGTQRPVAAHQPGRGAVLGG